MAHVISFSHLTIATVPENAWDEAWLALQTWKGLLQSFPGHHATRISGRVLENGDVRVFTTTTWDYPEELDEWRSSPYSAENLLTAIEPPAYDIVDETLEDFS